MSPSKKTVTGVGWVASAVYINAVISFGGNIFLVRLLVPEDFGIYALAVSFLSLLFVISGFGSQESIIQCRAETIQDLIPTAFWMTVGLGFGLAVAGSLLGLLLINSYGETVGVLIVLLSWLSLAGMISGVYGAILRRELIYKPIALTQTIGTLTSFGLALLAAHSNWGIWSLFVRQATQTVLELVGFARASGYRLELKFDWQTARWIWDFGWKVMGNRIGEVLFERMDKLVIGNFLGTAALGQYSIAYRLALIGHQFGYGVIHAVVYSTFARVQKELHSLYLLLEKLTYWLFRLVLLFGLLAWFCGSGLVVFIYGPQWQLAGSILQNMTVLLIVLPLETSLRVFLIGSGHVNSVLKVWTWQLLFFIPAILIATYWGGLVWTVWSINLSILLSWVLVMRYTSQVLAVRWSFCIKNPLVAGLISFVCVESITYMGYLTNGSFLEILLQGSLVGTTFIISLHLMERQALQAEWAMIRARLA
jgi:PST family polysaccharide transporter